MLQPNVLAEFGYRRFRGITVGVGEFSLPITVRVQQKNQRLFAQADGLLVFHPRDGQFVGVVIGRLIAITPSQNQHVIVAFGDIREAFVLRALVKGGVFLHTFDIKLGAFQCRLHHFAMFDEVNECG